MHRLAAIIALTLATTTVRGADRYVTTTGTASNAGTLASPWSLAKAFSSASAGDTVHVRGGTYTSGPYSISVSGTATQPIVFRNYAGETPILDMTGKSPTLDQSDSPIISIQNRSNLVVQGFILQNYITSNQDGLPEGILLAARSSGSCNNVRLLGNTIRNIQQNNNVKNNFDANAHGIKVAGRNGNAMTGIVIDGNQLYNLRLGASEAMPINGNVVGFRVTNNVIHDCNNIGIDLIGYEGSISPSIDRARDGVVSGNVVYNIDARYNPAYGGDFATGGGDPSAAGIYVDGGTRIIIERNVVYGCNYGVEIATEADLSAGATADFITLRNNLIRHNHQAGLIMGGYNSSRGATQNCTIVNNTFYANGTDASTVQIFGQHHVQNNVFKNNIIVAALNSSIVVGVYGSSAVSTFTGNTFSYNLYYALSGASPVFDLNGNKSLSQWQSAVSLSGGDVGSSVAEPQFADPFPSQGSPVTAWQLSASSPAINTGEPSPAYQPADGEDDFFGETRLRAGRVDRGADEF